MPLAVHIPLTRRTVQSIGCRNHSVSVKKTNTHMRIPKAYFYCLVLLPLVLFFLPWLAPFEIIHVANSSHRPFTFSFCTPVFLRALGPGTFRQAQPTSLEIQFPEACVGRLATEWKTALVHVFSLFLGAEGWIHSL